ncbi:MAG: fluoride efflux transporter CrcB [Tannerella sp.]|jgi:CrcB protein|nr:fluoride efflux transporter CrcB [Tannerella sp.]
MIRTIILIGIGGGIGSMLRYLFSIWIDRYVQAIFPCGTWVVNIAGCFLIGLLLGLFERNLFVNPDVKCLFVTGFCGGFTTFSTFAVENIVLFQTGNAFAAFLYMAASLLAGLLAVWAGLYMANL